MTYPIRPLRLPAPTFLASILCLCLAGVSPAQEAPDFEEDVWPILMDKCLVCHGPVDSFSKLRLDSKEAILKGGDSGKVVVPGDPEKSPMVVRTSLPADDFDVMPAEGDPLTPEQVDILRRWVAAGADFGDWQGF